MNTKKIIYGIFTCSVLLVAACTSSTAEDDELYERGIDKSEVIVKGIDKSEVIVKGIDKSEVIVK
ncbi:hypothetical protein LVD13_03760 [Flavobacteriaceae bacterium D16]|nr:hypothetical protein [Flavobacteriaceae bacterium D16]